MGRRFRWALCLSALLALACEERTPEAEEPRARPAPASETAESPQQNAPADGLHVFGDLHARVLGEMRGDGPVVVLLHGYGASGDDLVSLAEGLDVPETTRFVLPEAPIELGGSGRAWWRLDIDRLRRAEERDLSDEVPEGMPRARRQVMQLVRSVRHDFGVDNDRIVLAGFSQGAMLAMDTALHLDQPPAGVAALSGTLVSEDEWRPRMQSKAPMPVLLTHGRQDPLLPFSMAERLRDAATDAGLSVTWVPFDGGHSIPPPVVDALESFVDDVTD